MDTNQLIKAIEILFSPNDPVDVKNQAEQFINNVINDNLIIIDLQYGLTSNNSNVIFGVCNIIYQQMRQFRRTPNGEAISTYSNCLRAYIANIIESHTININEIAFNRVCLCYCVLQSFDEFLLTNLIEECYMNISKSPDHLRVYLNLYRCLLEEVDTNHLPESVKDIVVKVLISHKSTWEQLFYSLLQDNIDMIYKEQIIQCFSYSLFCFALPDLYSYPSEDQPESNFLSLLLQLTLSSPHSSLRHQILSLLVRLLELGSYPVHRLFDPAVKLIYSTMMSLCCDFFLKKLDDDEIIDLTHLLITMIQEAQSILIVNKTINMDIIQILLYLTSKEDKNFASLTLDSWLIISELDCFYNNTVVHENEICYTSLLLILRNQLVNTDVTSFSAEETYTQFNNSENQLKLLRNSEVSLNWKPVIAEDAKNEIFPAILELETSPFRHGPPGCEDVIRSLYSMKQEELLGYMLNQMKSETNINIFEADLYVISQFIEEINSSQEDYPITSSLLVLLTDLITICNQYLQSLQHESLLFIRQLSFLLIRIVLIKSTLPKQLIQMIISMGITIIQRPIECIYGCEILLNASYQYYQLLIEDPIPTSLISIYSNTSVIPLVRYKLAKLLITMYQHHPTSDQLTILYQLLETTFKSSSSSSLFEQIVSLYNGMMLFYTSYQLYSHLEEYPQAALVLQDAVNSLIPFFEHVTADCHQEGNQNEESPSLLAFCSFLQYSIRGWYVTLFNQHIQTIMSILLNYFQHNSRCGVLLHTIGILTKFYCNSYASSFYDTIKHIAEIALTNLNYNQEEYVREMMQLFANLPTVCGVQLNQDSACLSTILQIAEIYIHIASSRGKTACFSLLNRLVRMESDNDQIMQIIGNASSSFLNLVITECIHWERTLLRMGASFVFNLIMGVVNSSVERSRILIESLANQYPDVFTQEEYAKIATFFEKRLTQYLDLSQFVMLFMDVIGIINNTNTKDSLLSYEM